MEPGGKCLPKGVTTEKELYQGGDMARTESGIVMGRVIL